LLDSHGTPILKSNANRILASGFSNSAASLTKPVFKGWNWQGADPDSDIIQHLPIIRQRSRQLSMEAPIIAGLYRTLTTNVIGDGLRPEPTPDAEYLNLSADDVKKFKDQVLRLWETFAESPNCFDTETEVLTKAGWQLFSELTGDELLGTVNLKTDMLEYQKPTHLIAKEYSGNMVHIKGKRIDIFVTPDHRMVTYNRKWDGRKKKLYVDNAPEITYAKDLTKRHQIKRGCLWQGKKENVVIPASYRSDGIQIEPERYIDIGDWADFLGWYVSEGCRCESRNGKSIGRRVIIYQSKGWKSHLIREVLKRLPWKFQEGSRHFAITSKQLYEALEPCNDGCHHKRVPQIIKDSTPLVIERFLAAALSGDGHYRSVKRGNCYKSSKTYFTTSKLLADDIQELFLKVGLASRIDIRPPMPCRIRGIEYKESCGGFIVSSSNNIRASIDGGIGGQRKCLANTVKYEGMVYCATVPNSTLVCRRNGIEFIAGNCDCYRRDNFYELTRLAFRAQLESGDCFVTMPRFERRNAPFLLKIQVVEADCVDTPEGQESFEHEMLGYDVLSGVEISKWGHVVGYWFYTGQHKNATYRRSWHVSNTNKPKWIFIPAFGAETGQPNVLHLMETMRPGQRRGIPLIAPTIELALTLDRYIKSEAVAAHIQSLFTLVIKSNNPEALSGEIEALISGREGYYNENEVRLGSGNIQFLRPGDDVTPVASSRPTTSFEPFINSVIQQIGTPTGMPYEMLVQKFQASYSASMAAMNMARGDLRVKRSGIVVDFCNPVFVAFMDEAVARGLLDAPGYFDDQLKRRAYTRVKWNGPGLPQMDFGKEVSGWLDAIAAGLATASQATSELNGGDYMENLSIRKREIEAAKAAGLSVAAAQGMTSSAGAIKSVEQSNADQEAISNG
jgi:lambda family phage portal protein